MIRLFQYFRRWKLLKYSRKQNWAYLVQQCLKETNERPLSVYSKKRRSPKVFANVHTIIYEEVVLEMCTTSCNVHYTHRV